MIQAMCLRGGLLLAHEPVSTEEALSAALRSFRPTFLFGVPYLFEKIYKNFLRKAQQAGRGPLFERAVRTAQDYALAAERQRLDTGPGPAMDLKLQHAFYEKTVYRKLRAALGGRVRAGCSGGSPSTATSRSSTPASASSSTTGTASPRPPGASPPSRRAGRSSAPWAVRCRGRRSGWPGTGRSW